jgi:hypothetical protein
VSRIQSNAKHATDPGLLSGTKNALTQLAAYVPHRLRESYPGSGSTHSENGAT